MIGLDLGGTKIAAALLGPDGTVLARHNRSTSARDGAAAVLDALAGAAATVDLDRLRPRRLRLRPDHPRAHRDL